jgi:CheY-like chemotaxis protein
VEADSGETALELLSAGLEPGFICLDLTMPGIGGTETLRRIKEAGYPFPVVVVTADMQRRTVEEVRSLGAADVLGKPVDPARLKALAAIYAEVGA